MNSHCRLPQEAIATEMAGSWSQVEIGGKLADVYEPASSVVPDQAILHLHGHGLTTLNDSASFTAELDRHGLRAICPHGQRSWWLDVVCDEFDREQTPIQFLRKMVIPFIKDRWNVEPPRIGLTGISMGGQGVLQLAYRFAREFPVVVAISPAVDFHNWHGQGLPLDEMFETPEAARQQTVLLQVVPLGWPQHQMIVCDPTDADWFESSQRLTSKLYSSGIPFESDLKTTAGGHSWDYFDAMAPAIMDFVADRLARI